MSHKPPMTKYRVRWPSWESDTIHLDRDDIEAASAADAAVAWFRENHGYFYYLDEAEGVVVTDPDGVATRWDVELVLVPKVVAREVTT